MRLKAIEKQSVVVAVAELTNVCQSIADSLDDIKATNASIKATNASIVTRLDVAEKQRKLEWAYDHTKLGALECITRSSGRTTS